MTSTPPSYPAGLASAIIGRPIASAAHTSPTKRQVLDLFRNLPGPYQA